MGIDSSEQHEVIVIGAGAAGLAAAHELLRRGVKGVLILEARDRIGGRVWTSNLNGTPIDLGASWIHTINDNPIAELAIKYQIDTVPTIYSSANMINKFSSYEIYDNTNKKINLAAMNDVVELVAKFNLAIDDGTLRLNQKASYADAVRTFITQNDINENGSQLFYIVVSRMIECEFAADLDKISVYLTNAISNLDGDDVLAIGGYMRLLLEHAKSLNIHLNEVVNQVEYDEHGVTITTKNNLYHSKYVVVTLPLGVLQNNSVQFLPALPHKKQIAIKNLRMGYFNKICLLFDKPFWNLGTEWIAKMPDTQELNTNYEILNLYKYTQQPILIFFTAGSFSQELEKWTDQQVIDYFMRILNSIYQSNVSRLAGYLITRWGKDPFACGSYSYPSITARIEDYQELAEPILNRLFFAGEATNVNNSSTVHGAYISGITAAKLISEQIDNNGK
jgi:monoamine oxidase